MAKEGGGYNSADVVTIGENTLHQGGEWPHGEAGETRPRLRLLARARVTKEAGRAICTNEYSSKSHPDPWFSSENKVGRDGRPPPLRSQRHMPEVSTISGHVVEKAWLG